MVPWAYQPWAQIVTDVVLEPVVKVVDRAPVTPARRTGPFARVACTCARVPDTGVVAFDPGREGVGPARWAPPSSRSCPNGAAPTPAPPAAAPPSTPSSVRPT